MRLTIFLTSLLLSCSVLSAEKYALWLNVPFVHQRPNACGAAAVSMILQYWQTKGYLSEVNSDPLQIEEDLYSSELDGILASKLNKYLTNSGLRTFVFSGKWEDLRAHLEKGRPLLVALKSSSNHYVVVAGMDREQNVLLVNDPARRKLLKISRNEFEQAWEKNQYWTLLALPQK